MKTTLEIPDKTFRQAKSKAAQQGIPLRQFITEAVEEKLKGRQVPASKPWMKHLGRLKHLRKESKRIDRLIEQTFDVIEPETWH